MTLPAPRPFEVASADGTWLRGQVDLPATPSGVAVIFASGSGLFDRDMRYGRSGTPRDLVFKDLAARRVARGARAGRHDRRGVRYGAQGPDGVDSAVTITATTAAQVADLAAIYDWTRHGLGAERVVFLAHSEGALHVGRLAASGAAAPARLVGLGALMESPASVLFWQMAGRDADAIARLDADGDGVITNAEVRAGIRRTPAAHSALDDLLSPTGAWDAADLDGLRTRQAAAHARAKSEALAMADDASYPPGGPVVAGPGQWWKSWFVDDIPNARNLARWDVDLHLHYGAIDSQTDAIRQEAAARVALPAARLRLTVHPGLGHALGEDPAIGPMVERVAEAVADDAAR